MAAGRSTRAALALSQMMMVVLFVVLSLARGALGADAPAPGPGPIAGMACLRQPPAAAFLAPAVLLLGYLRH
ncbi:unnamed protein product [Spirodela intermedia]|uniref:Uncharacterized protein n=1 Tax=Spirodela intermedia TaxID=51605 RepID=A0A7I8KYP4_SPIIN|nr:unnamed protein product [Spirodela intermedia]